MSDNRVVAFDIERILHLRGEQGGTRSFSLPSNICVDGRESGFETQLYCSTCRRQPRDSRTAPPDDAVVIVSGPIAVERFLRAHNHTSDAPAAATSEV